MGAKPTGVDPALEEKKAGIYFGCWVETVRWDGMESGTFKS
jgi:hypothetical protein